jgi:hypothetical protein
MSRLVLIGCAKTKRKAEFSEARDLYTSPLFAKRRRYAEASREQWAILSALHGIIRPEQTLRPYDVTLKSAAQVSNLSALLAFQLNGSWSDVDAIEVHAGSLYVEAVMRATARIERAAGPSIVVDVPLRGLQIGEQLSWYGPRIARMTGRRVPRGVRANH